MKTRLLMLSLTLGVSVTQAGVIRDWRLEFQPGAAVVVGTLMGVHEASFVIVDTIKSGHSPPVICVQTYDIGEVKVERVVWGNLSERFVPVAWLHHRDCRMEHVEPWRTLGDWFSEGQEGVWFLRPRGSLRGRKDFGFTLPDSLPVIESFIKRLELLYQLDDVG